MNLFIMTSFFNVLASLICLIAAIKVFLVVRGRRRESINIKYYFYALFFVAVYLFVGALPFFAIKNPYLIVASTTFFRPLLIISGMFLTLIAINLSRVKMINAFYIYLTIIIVYLSSVFIIVGISQISGSAFYIEEIERWMRPDNSLIITGTLIVGLFFSLSIFSSFIFYTHFALKQKQNKVAFGKAIMMATGCLMFFLAGVSKYIIGIMPGNFALTSIAASFLFVMGSIAFVSSVNYKGEKKNIS